MVDRTLPETLETSRLLLRPRTREDAALNHQLWTERDPRVPAERRIDESGRPTVEEVADRLDDEPGLLSVVRKDTGEVIGYCGVLFHGNGGADDPEIAYELARAFHGLGFATEAASAVVEWARDAGFPAIWATVWDWNAPSRRILAKLGFRETGEIERTGPAGDSLLTVREF